jgi:hypothetical protein
MGSDIHFDIAPIAKEIAKEVKISPFSASFPVAAHDKRLESGPGMNRTERPLLVRSRDLSDRGDEL